MPGFFVRIVLQRYTRDVASLDRFHVTDDAIDLAQRSLPWAPPPPHPKNHPKPFMTQSEVARELGLSRQSVFEIERRALRKLRLWLEAHGMGREQLL